MTQPRNARTGQFASALTDSVRQELQRFFDMETRPTYQDMVGYLYEQHGFSTTINAIRMYMRRLRRRAQRSDDALMSEPEKTQGDITALMARVAELEARQEKGKRAIYHDDAESGRDFAKENAELRQVNRRLYEKLQSAKARSEDLVRATLEGARDAMLSLGHLEPVPQLCADTRAHHGETALWVLTDWQGGKSTASYNSEVMRERVQRFCRKAHLITDIQRADHPVRDCVIAFGGDMVEGLFNFPTQAHEIDATLFGQFVNVSRLLVETVQFALNVYEHVTVVAEWGNHGRIGGKRDGVPRPDNTDRMCYELARQLLSNETRLTWHDCPEDIQRIEIGNYRAILLHSDEIGRNGYASPMTIVQYIVRQKSGAYPWRFRDAYIGHWHNHCEFALPDGEGAVYQTGSTESDNRYAGVHMAATALPSQRLHFIDTERGRVSAQYKIYLDKD
jgi:hypothetical protein